MAGNIEEAIFPPCAARTGTFAPGCHDLLGKEPRLSHLPIIIELAQIGPALIKARRRTLVIIIGKAGPPKSKMPNGPSQGAEPDAETMGRYRLHRGGVERFQ